MDKPWDPPVKQWLILFRRLNPSVKQRLLEPQGKDHKRKNPRVKD